MTTPRTLSVTVPAPNEAARRYVVDIVLNRWFGLSSPDLLSVVVDPDATETIIKLVGHEGEVRIADVVLSRDLDDVSALRNYQASAKVDLGLVGPALCEVADVPVLFGDIPQSGIPATSPLDGAEGVSINVDLFGTIFALLTGLEDRFIPERDGHGRVPMVASLLHRRGLTERPVVDELAEVLWAAMANQWPGLTPTRRQGSVRVTQDVDRMGKFGRSSLADIALSTAAGARRGGKAEAVSTLKTAIGVRSKGRHTDPHYNFDRFMDIVEGHGHQAGFYFICRFNAHDGTRLGSYSLEDPFVIDLIRTIGRRGHQMGVHPGYQSHLDIAALRADAAALRSVWRAADVEPMPVGGRHHYLRWDTHLSPACWQAAGLTHDSSLGYAEDFGFRVGTSKPFPLWDHQTSQATTVDERPLIFMDAAAPGLGYQFGDDELANRLKGLRDTCTTYNGDFTILVHNEDFSHPGAQDLLTAILS